MAALHALLPFEYMIYCQVPKINLLVHNTKRHLRYSIFINLRQTFPSEYVLRCFGVIHDVSLV